MECYRILLDKEQQPFRKWMLRQNRSNSRCI